MREMKDSGIEWIGIIPKGWNISRLKYIAKFFNGDRGKNYPSGEDLVDDGIAFLTSNNIHGIVLDCSQEKSKFITEERYNRLGGAKIQLNDIAFCLRGSVGNCAINKTLTKGTVASSLMIIRPIKASPDFINYVLQTDVCDVQTIKAMNGSCAANLSAENVSNYYFVEPPIVEQKKIAIFLDSRCSEIDAISADIQKEIETLEKYKRSVITETVTKGLNPEAEMKDSGAEWIGKVPTNWDLGRIGGFYSLRNEKVSDKDYPPLSVTMKGILPQLETAAKTNDGDNRKLVRKGDFAINSRSDRRGSCGISKYDGSVSLINTVLTPRGKMSAAYYDWVFHCTRFSDEFYRQGHGIVDDLWTTGWQEMKKIIIPVPPFLEQNEIADYLASKCSDIDSVISQKNQQLETLSNYKKILIYEYVTGKKEVLI